MNKIHRLVLPAGFAIAVCIFTFFCTGCKAPPARQTTPFISDTAGMMPVPEIKAYHKSWARNDADWAKFKKIFVAPVSTKYLQERAGWQKSSFAEYDPKGVGDLAAFTRQAFIAAHRANTSTNRLEVVDHPDSGTIILEMAITELVPTKAWLNTVTTAAIGWAPDKGLIALEARLREGPGGRVIAVFADREQGKDSIFNVKSFTWYSHARAIIEEWAKQSVEVTNAAEGTVISDSPAFELKAW
ncbi:MAG: DUF3313 family protein [Kiritimatiellia bacterium]